MSVSVIGQQKKLGLLCRYGALGLAFILVEFHLVNFAGILSYHAAISLGLSFQAASQIWLLLLLLSHAGFYLIARAESVQQFSRTELKALMSEPYAAISLFIIALLCGFNGFVLEYYTGDDWGHIARVAWSQANPGKELPLLEVAVAAPFNQMKGYFLPYAYPYVLGFMSSLTGINLPMMHFNIGGFIAGLCYPSAIYILARQIGLKPSAACWTTVLGLATGLVILKITQDYGGWSPPAIAWTYPWMQRSMVFLIELPLVSACFLGFVQSGRWIFLIGLFWITTAAVGLGQNSLVLIPVVLFCWGLSTLLRADTWVEFRIKLVRCLAAVPAVFYLIATLVVVRLSLDQSFRLWMEPRDYWFHFERVSAEISLIIVAIAALGLKLDGSSKDALVKILYFSGVLLLVVLSPWSYSSLSVLMGGAASSYWRFFYLLPTVLLSGIIVFTLCQLLMRVDLVARCIQRHQVLSPVLTAVLAAIIATLVAYGPLHAFPLSFRPKINAELERQARQLAALQLTNPILGDRYISKVLPVYDINKIFLIQFPAVTLNSASALDRLEDGIAIRDASNYVSYGRRHPKYEKSHRDSFAYVVSKFKVCTVIMRNGALRKDGASELLNSLGFHREIALTTRTVFIRQRIAGNSCLLTETTNQPDVKMKFSKLYK